MGRDDSSIIKRGDFVQVWFDTGAMGTSILYGEVIASGPKAFRVRWESGGTNRVHRDRMSMSLAEDKELAAEACRKETRQ